MIQLRKFDFCTILSRACGSVAVKSTGTWVYGEMKIWTEDHFHFLVSLLIPFCLSCMWPCRSKKHSDLVIGRVYDLSSRSFMLYTLSSLVHVALSQ